jgi:hypothetical protein
MRLEMSRYEFLQYLKADERLQDIPVLRLQRGPGTNAVSNSNRLASISTVIWMALSKSLLLSMTYWLRSKPFSANAISNTILITNQIS